MGKGKGVRANGGLKKVPREIMSLTAGWDCLELPPHLHDTNLGDVEEAKTLTFDVESVFLFLCLRFVVE